MSGCLEQHLWLETFLSKWEVISEEKGWLWTEAWLFRVNMIGWFFHFLWHNSWKQVFGMDYVIGCVQSKAASPHYIKRILISRHYKHQKIWWSGLWWWWWKQVILSSYYVPGTLLAVLPVLTHLHFTKILWDYFLAPLKRWRNWGTDRVGDLFQGTQLVNGRITGHMVSGCLLLTPYCTRSLRCSVWEGSLQRAQGCYTLLYETSCLVVFLMWVCQHHLYPLFFSMKDIVLYKYFSLCF